MFARSVIMAAADNPIKLLNGERVPAGWYMVKVGYDPNALADWGGFIIYFAPNGVDLTSPDNVNLGPAETQLVHLSEPTEILVARRDALKARLVITEV